jgi:arginine-tRNA-protein transferase
MKANSDLVVVPKPAIFDNRHYRLYRRYLQSRHAEGRMSEATPEEYFEFLNCGWGDTAFYEFLENGNLLAVAVVDHLDDGLSAVYTFYDPGTLHRSLGTFAVLWQIAEAQRRRLPWLYLGFWISACRKMAYKGAFRPLQALLGSRWVRLDRGRNGSS